MKIGDFFEKLNDLIDWADINFDSQMDLSEAINLFFELEAWAEAGYDVEIEAALKEKFKARLKAEHFKSYYNIKELCEDEIKDMQRENKQVRWYWRLFE